MNLRLKATLASVLSLGLAFASVGAAEASPRTNLKVTICHRTHATTNPYRQITVNMASIVGNGNSGNGHGDTTPGGGQDDPLVTADHSHNPYLTAAGSVFDYSYSYPANHKQWQDIIPPFTYVPANGNPGSFAGLNWTDLGKAIYYGYTYNGHNYSGLCTKMSAKDFAQKEYEEFLADNPNATNNQKNAAKNNAAQDVKDQGANEDGNTTGKNYDNLPDPAQKPSGPKIPDSVKTLQETLDSANNGQTNKTQAISGVVWLDADRDGVEDDNETDFENVEIHLVDPLTGQNYVPNRLRAQSIGIATVTPVVVYTNADGYFQIDNVPEGDWTVKVITPSGYTYTYDSNGIGDGRMPGTYVPSGGIGFAWAGLVNDPNSGSNGSGSGSGSGSDLANTGSELPLVPLTLGFLSLIAGGIAVLRRK